MNKLDDKQQALLICLFLTVIMLSVFLQVQDYDFVGFDDNEYITENRHVKTGLTSENVIWAFTTFYASNWHPLTWISHMLDCQLFGLKPGFHHSVNLLFHIANTLLLFLILHRMTKALWQSAFVAAIFAMHPLHVESVAWVAERKDVLSTFFWMLTMGAYVFYVERRGLKRYLLTFLFFALGLMAKPMLVTLPFVLLLLDYWPLRRLTTGKPSVNEHTQSERSLKRHRKKKERRSNAIQAEHINKTEKQTRQQPLMVQIILEKVPFFVLSLASSIVTYMAQQKGGAVSSLQRFPLPARIANALVSYCAYIWKTIWPENLAVLYPHPGMLPAWKILGAVLFLGIITFLIIRTMKRYPYLTTGWFWYLGTLVPVIGLVQVGAQAMADRYTYVPLIGVLIMVAWGIPELSKKWRHRDAALAALAVITLSIFSYASWKQVEYWQSSVTLFKHALDATSNNYVALNNFGITLRERGRLDEAINHYSEALQIKPDYAVAHNNLGITLQEQGRLDEASYHYSEALRIKPNFADAHNNLGTALQQQGRLEEAIAHYAEAIRINPDYTKAYVNLGEALASQGKLSEAMAFFSKALRIKPDDYDALLNIGVTAAKKGNLDAAASLFARVLQFKPDYAEAHANLGITLMQKGNLNEAIAHLREAIRLMPSNPEYYFALGRILAKKGNLDEAIAHYSRALQINPDYAEAHNNMGIILARKGKVDEAISQFREALRIRPEYKEAHNNLQVALAEQRKTR